MRRTRFTYILTILAVSSCMAMDLEMLAPPESDAGFHFLTGKVSGLPENEPIEHIKVTIDWNNGAREDIKYTSSDGSFTAEVPEGTKKTIPVAIRLEDIDGDENGGTFESQTDNLIFSIDPDSPTGVLAYRLNRATP